jgi:trehalose 2-sulfotransferase
VVTPCRSYLICSVQRAGGWLLCHALEDTGVLGGPAEYFHRGDEEFWRDRWAATTEDAFLQELRERPTTANGVWGSKMMWNYFAEALARLRAWPRLGLEPGVSDPDVLAAAFPGLRYVWLRRQDKVRQAISWWRADATGQYALAEGEQAKQPPAFDREAIGRLVQFAEECEAGWREWFATHSITPLEIVYEEMVPVLTEVVRDLAAFLGVMLPTGVGQVHPRLQLQADHHTERLVELFNSPGP